MHVARLTRCADCRMCPHDLWRRLCGLSRREHRQAEKLHVAVPAAVRLLVRWLEGIRHDWVLQ